MNDGNMVFVNGEYGESKQEKYPREIKTKPTSYEAITKKYENFLMQAKSDLENMKDAALNSTFTKEETETQITQISKSIARLEEMIKTLSNENVPTNYVDNRAIKLKKSMMENLTKKVGDLYSIDAEKKEEIFAQDKLEFGDAIPDVAVVAANNESEMVSNDDSLNREIMSDIVDEQLNEARAREQAESTMEVSDTIAPIPAVAEVTEGIEEYSKSPDTNEQIDNDTIKSVISEELDNISAIPEISPEEVQETVTVDEPVQDNMENTRILHNDTINAKLSRFDENGNPIDNSVEQPVEVENKENENQQSVVEDTSIHTIDPYDLDSMKDRQIPEWKPMTDEEIRKAQIKLGFDENGNMINQSTEETEKVEPVNEDKESPAVVEEEIPEYSITDQEEKPQPEIEVEETNSDESQFKASNTTKTTLEAYKKLKENVLRLREEQTQSKREADQAIEDANSAKQKAREIREMLAESDNSVAQSMQLLETYKKALEEDNYRNNETKEAALKRAQEDYEYVSENERKIRDNDQLVDEIKSLIGDTVDPESIKRI